MDNTPMPIIILLSFLLGFVLAPLTIPLLSAAAIVYIVYASCVSAVSRKGNTGKDEKVGYGVSLRREAAAYGTSTDTFVHASDLGCAEEGVAGGDEIAPDVRAEVERVQEDEGDGRAKHDAVAALCFMLGSLSALVCIFVTVTFILHTEEIE